MRTKQFLTQKGEKYYFELHNQKKRGDGSGLSGGGCYCPIEKPKELKIRAEKNNFEPGKNKFEPGKVKNVFQMSRGHQEDTNIILFISNEAPAAHFMLQYIRWEIAKKSNSIG